MNLRIANRSIFRDDVAACWLIRQGHVVVGWGSEEQRFEAGHWVLWPPGARRWQRFSNTAHIMSIRFWPGEDGNWHGFPLVLGGSHLLTALAERLVQSADAASGTASGYCHHQSHFFTFAAAWWDEILSHDGAFQSIAIQDRRLQRALDLLTEHAGIGSLPYDQMCFAAGCSRAQLDRIAHQQLHCSLRAWHEQHIIRRAQEVLQQDHLTIEACAHALGFADGSHFAKWFRRQTGFSPRQWRRHGGV